MKKTAILSMLALGLAVVACGDDEDDNNNNVEQLTEQEVAQTLGAVGVVTAQAAANVDFETGTGMVSCASGGSASFSGDFSDLNSISFTSAFTDCSDGSVTVNGTLTIMSSVMLDGTSVNSSSTVTGSIVVTGDVQASCTFNYTVSISGGQTTYSGTACGISVDNLVINGEG